MGSRDHVVGDRVKSHLLAGENIVEAMPFNFVWIWPKNKAQQSQVCPDMKTGVDNT